MSEADTASPSLDQIFGFSVEWGRLTIISDHAARSIIL